MKKTLLILLLMVLAMGACSPAVIDPALETAAPEEDATPTTIPSPTPTEVPPVVLTVCTASLPETLFPYAGSATAAKTRVMDLLFPTLLSSQDGQLIPLVFEKLPSEADGSLRLEPVPIRRGQTVVDARGELVTAIEGVRVRPSGCREADCAITWNGLEPLEMDQMAVDFTLRDGLTWPDGTPVRAADAVFSYRLASDPASPTYGWAEARTQGFSALDERTVAWRGYPGFASPEPARFFWLPLPSGAFDSGVGFDSVAAEPLWASAPPAYGPFAVLAWTAEELRLVRIPGHPLGDDLLPGVDQVVFRPLDGGAAAGWEGLQAGTCDMLDASLRLAEEPELLAAIEVQGGFELHITGSASWTQLVFGIKPAEYDALANPVFAQRPDYFGDARTRLGIAQCLDREAMAAATGGTAWPSFLPPEESQLDAAIPYDPTAGADLLAAVGWQDHDNNPDTPRLAQDVLTVFNNVPLALNLLVGPSPFHQDLAGNIAEALRACGVGVNVQTLTPAELYAPGPDGPLFGRRFDLALIAWQPLPGPDCGLYTSWAVPGAGNGWIGTNIAGFASNEYDAACTAAALALPAEAQSLLASAEAVFLETLPAIPLVAPLVVEVWSVDN